ncbi:HIT-like domain-containing protein [Mrakia frigida]|uniref:HIT family protein n=1 Tax=Mrakia frigida TaxID=29902 RepID=UPI003FCBF5BA
MTSYILAAQEGLPVWEEDSDASCIFCKIVAGTTKAFKVWEDELTVAFLDKMPLRRGHVLLIPKLHCPRVSDLPGNIGAALGRALPKVTKALSLGLNNPDLNIVLNQGYAQAVNHAHFHLIPAPLKTPPPTDLLADSLSSVAISSTASNSPHGKKKDAVAAALLRTPADVRANPPSHQEMIEGERSFRLAGMLGDRDAEEISGLIRSQL